MTDSLFSCSNRTGSLSWAPANDNRTPSQPTADENASGPSTWNTDRMGISRHTVHTHAKNVYHKLYASGRTQVIRKAKLSGLLDPQAE